MRASRPRHPKLSTTLTAAIFNSASLHLTTAASQAPRRINHRCPQLSVLAPHDRNIPNLLATILSSTPATGSVQMPASWPQHSKLLTDRSPVAAQSKISTTRPKTMTLTEFHGGLQGCAGRRRKRQRRTERHAEVRLSMWEGRPGRRRLVVLIPSSVCREMPAMLAPDRSPAH
ncbi:hypothetical protein IWZ01DRAFT_506967 [Phyllosticta capitalensis]